MTYNASNPKSLTLSGKYFSSLLELEALSQDSIERKAAAPRKPRRMPLPADLPRREFHHEPASTQCPSPGCGAPLQRMGEDITEKLDYTPGTFTVERHVRGKWVCRCCETLVQAPVPACVIDKGIPTEGLLAHVLVAKYADHMPLARQEKIFARAGLGIARSTLAQWVGQCGVQLQPLVDALRGEAATHFVQATRFLGSFSRARQGSAAVQCVRQQQLGGVGGVGVVAIAAVFDTPRASA